MQSTCFKHFTFCNRCVTFSSKKHTFQFDENPNFIIYFHCNWNMHWKLFNIKPLKSIKALTFFWIRVSAQAHGLQSRITTETHLHLLKANLRMIYWLNILPLDSIAKWQLCDTVNLCENVKCKWCHLWPIHLDECWKVLSQIESKSTIFETQ